MIPSTDATLFLLFIWAIAVLPQYISHDWLRRISR